MQTSAQPYVSASSDFHTLELVPVNSRGMRAYILLLYTVY